MDLRAHHLLCMRYFKGKGYSKGFVSNFRKVLKRLKKERFVLVDYPDAICKACPHLIGERCAKKPGSERKVKGKDDKFLRIMGLKSRKQIYLIEAERLVSLKLERLRKTCKHCEWKDWCK